MGPVGPILRRKGKKSQRTKTNNYSEVKDDKNETCEVYSRWFQKEKKRIHYRCK